VPGEQLKRALDTVLAGPHGGSPLSLCRATTEIVGVSGAGITLMSRDVAQGSVCSTDAVSALIEDLQFSLGEGPCVDAYRTEDVVAEPDLADPVTARWPAFTPAVVQAGARAVFGFPLRIGSVRLGALDLYRDTKGQLTDEQHADGLAIANVAAVCVLDGQAGVPAGSLAMEMDTDSNFHFIVHNAAGIVSVQLGISVTDALIRLRAYSFSRERPLGDVARDVVDRTLHLE
jgi:hypothetical protein